MILHAENNIQVRKDEINAAKPWTDQISALSAAIERKQQRVSTHEKAILLAAEARTALLTDVQRKEQELQQLKQKKAEVDL